MRAWPTWVLLCAALSAAGCAISLEPADPGDAGPRRDVAATDAIIHCRTSDECPSGWICDGNPGCEVPWTCVPEHDCLRVESTFCDCAGNTFHSPDSCARQQYAHRGACEMPPPPDVPDVADVRDVILQCTANGVTCERSSECCSGYCMGRGAPLGVCAVVPDHSVVCGDGDLLCDTQREYCELTYSDVPTPDSATCVSIPGPCEGMATCDCVDQRPCSLACRMPDAHTLAFQCPGG